MGPGSFDPGSVIAPDNRYRALLRFNGAGVFRPRKFSKARSKPRGASVLQWGRGLSTPEVIESLSVAIEKSPLQWGRGLSTPEVSRSITWPTITNRRFNGAGVFRPRKSSIRARVAPFAARFNGAGVFRPRKSAAARPSRPPPGGFNGAGVFRPRKFAACVCVPPRSAALQWGRGLSTPEVARYDRRGDDAQRLQWGRGLSTPEVSGKCLHSG